MEQVVGTAVPAEGPRQADGIIFTASRGRLFGLVLGNILLTILTLGIYRFWAKTRIRRFFWSAIQIDGEPFEYTGRGVELFVGFLIALAVLVPLGMAFGLLGYLLETWVPDFLFLSDVLYFAALGFLIPFALFRMWRYRLSRTCWRGIRFALEGKASHYAVRAFGWGIVVALSLGFAMPWMTVSLVGYRARRVHFGTAKFDFQGRARDLLGRWAIFWGGFLALVVVAIVLAATFNVMTSGSGVSPRAWALPILLGGVVSFAGLFFLGLWYRIFEFRYLTSCVTFAQNPPARFRSEASVGGILPMILLTGIVVLLVLGTAGAAVSGGISAMIEIEPGAFESAEQTVAVAMGIGAMAFLGVILFLPLVTYPLMIFEIVKHLWETLSVEGMDVFEKAAQAEDAQPKFGEGLADAFDVGAF